MKPNVPKWVLFIHCAPWDILYWVCPQGSGRSCWLVTGNKRKRRHPVKIIRVSFEIGTSIWLIRYLHPSATPETCQIIVRFTWKKVCRHATLFAGWATHFTGQPWFGGCGPESRDSALYLIMVLDVGFRSFNGLKRKIGPESISHSSYHVGCPFIVVAIHLTCLNSRYGFCTFPHSILIFIYIYYLKQIFKLSTLFSIRWINPKWELDHGNVIVEACT